MPLVPEPGDIALRITLTVIAAGILGLERGRAGKAAGLRTTLLVALAACLAMLQVNLLLPQAGKTPESFAVLDLMRLPLGILTGVGFIGAGAILRRGATVVGLTTAATMWYVTVLGLLFGGGQIVLGIVGSILGFVAVELLQFVEARVPRRRAAVVTVRFDRRLVDGDEVQALLGRPPFALVRVSCAITPEGQTEDRVFHLRWTSRATDHAMPPVVRDLAGRDGVLLVRWEGGGIADD